MEIRIAAAAIMRKDGATLVVRKRGTTAFMQPGGKIDGEETPLAALQRELFEELGLAVTPHEVDYIGRFTAPAANERGYQVIAELFRLQVDTDLSARAEIEEIRWLAQNEKIDLELAPMTRDQVLPAVWGQ